MTLDDYNDYRGILADIACLALPDAAERRRYAILQAAATIFSVNRETTHNAVFEAECLLEEIEKREKAEAQS